MLDAIQDKLGIDNDADSELADLEQDTKPEDVVAEIARIQKRVLHHEKLVARALSPTHPAHA